MTHPLLKATGLKAILLGAVLALPLAGMAGEEPAPPPAARSADGGHAGPAAPATARRDVPHGGCRW